MSLTSTLVDEETQRAPIRFASDRDGSVWIETECKLGRKTLAELKLLGVERKRSVALPKEDAESWHQAVSLQLAPEREGEEEFSEVLFELSDPTDFSEIVTEMLRLGNDRQSFRTITENGGSTTLVRVQSPPYYTLLRALPNETSEETSELEREASSRIAAEGEASDTPGLFPLDDTEGDDSSRPRTVVAYWEQAPRVWVPLGLKHPVGNQLSPPAGTWLIISRSNRWRFIGEGQFRDVYENLELRLPAPSETLEAGLPSDKIQIPLSLRAGSNQEAAELWVLERDSMKQVESLIRNSDEQLIARIAFAVVDSAHSDSADESTGADSARSGPVVLLRLRPSKLPPPVLVLDAVAFRPYLKIPHLFMPIGSRLHPPLRRDAVCELLARDSDRLTWLMPHQSNSFVSQSVPDVAFRPLSDWVDYVMDHEAVALQAWARSFQFDFESFVCADDLVIRQAPTPPPVVQEKVEEFQVVRDGQEPSSSQSDSKPTKPTQTDSTDQQPTLQPQQDELTLQLRALEQQFLDSDEAIDSSVRLQWWKQMGELNTQLGNRHDLTVCWSQSLWGQDVPSGAALGWLSSEVHAGGYDSHSAEAIRKIVRESQGRVADSSLVVSYLTWAASQGEDSSVAEMLPELTQFLLEHEGDLPVRSAWLGWKALYQLSGNDLLLLARARDRILDRLFEQGLSPEFDMATFMRTGGGNDDERFRVLRKEMVRLRGAAKSWIVEPKPPAAIDPQTGCYADLIFAYAMARLGENAECQAILQDVDAKLNTSDTIHGWVRRAFQLRIDQALTGQAHRGELSEELMADLENMDRLERYKLDRLRQQSRILEPHVRIDAYRNWHQGFPDELTRALAELQNIADHGELKNRITGLMEEYTDADQRVKLLPDALQLAPRIGEEFAATLLSYVPGLLTESDQAMDHALMLQASLQLAAHFGRADHCQQLAQSLSEILPDLVSDYLSIGRQASPEQKEKAQTIESLLSKSFQGLRKMGMRDEIGRLYGLVAELVESNPKGGSRRAEKDSTSRAQRLLLCVATGWYYFGLENEARAISDKVRATLRGGGLAVMEQKNLTCAYLEAIAQAPVEESIQRVEEILSVDEKGESVFPRISDQMTTASHFSVSQLQVLEESVLALVNDDFSLSPDARRWLDEDEYLVRSRIHLDVRQADAR